MSVSVLPYPITIPIWTASHLSFSISPTESHTHLNRSPSQFLSSPLPSHNTHLDRSLCQFLSSQLPYHNTHLDRSASQFLSSPLPSHNTHLDCSPSVSLLSYLVTSPLDKRRIYDSTRIHCSTHRIHLTTPTRSALFWLLITSAHFVKVIMSKL